MNPALYPGPLCSSSPQHEELCQSQTQELKQIKRTEDKYVNYLEEVGIHSEKHHPVRS